MYVVSALAPGPAAYLAVHVITQLEFGGAQLATLAQCSKSRFAPSPSYLICGPHGYLQREARQSLGPRLLCAPALQRRLHAKRDLQAFMQIRQHLRNLAARFPKRHLLVHTHSSKAGIVGRWAAHSAGAACIVHSIHGFGHQPGHMSRGRFFALHAIERLTAQITDGFTVDSQANLDRARVENIIGAHPVDVIPCNVDLRPFITPPPEVASLRESLQIPKDHLVVLQVGCLKPQKDPLTYVRVAAAVLASHRQVTFLLAGDGELLAAVRQAVATAGLAPHFRILGWRRDVPALLHVADVVMLTSLWEGLPQVFGQAMAAARSLVATRVDGAAEAIEDGVTGLLCEPGDVAGLTCAVLSLLRDPGRRRAMGERARARAGRFDESIMLRRLDAFYTRLASVKSAVHANQHA